MELLEKNKTKEINVLLVSHFRPNHGFALFQDISAFFNPVTPYGTSVQPLAPHITFRHSYLAAHNKLL
jgi:hypothetical protein